MHYFVLIDHIKPQENIKQVLVKQKRQEHTLRVRLAVLNEGAKTG